MADQYEEPKDAQYRESQTSPMRQRRNDYDPNDRGDRNNQDFKDAPRRQRRGNYSPSQDECTSAMLCHLLAIFSGFIGPLIMWSVKKDQSRFCDYHGRESLNFSLNLFIFNLLAAAIVGVVTLITCGIGAVLFPLILCVYVYGLVMHIIALTAANRGEWYRYPMTFRIISPPEGIGSVSTGDQWDAASEEPAATSNKKRSLTWLWILGGVFCFLLLGGGCIAAFFIVLYSSSESANVVSSGPVVVSSGVPAANEPSANGAAPNVPGKGRPKPRDDAQNPPAGADVPDVAADPVGKALTELQSGDNSKQVRAANSLARLQPEQARHDEVIKALQKLLQDNDLSKKVAAGRALAVWATTKEDVPVLLDAFKVASFVDKKRIVETFGSLKDPRTIKPLVESVQDLSLRASAEKALIAMGPQAEDEVATLLSDRVFATRQSACNIMKDIGTKKSLPALESAAKDRVPAVSKAAQDAIAAIKARNP
jgi:uncharacterized Tic20 family protein